MLVERASKVSRRPSTATTRANNAEGTGAGAIEVEETSGFLGTGARDEARDFGAGRCTTSG